MNTMDDNTQNPQGVEPSEEVKKPVEGAPAEGGSPAPAEEAPQA